MEQLIEVSPINDAWRLSASGCFEPTLFLSGGRAEQAARLLARRLARVGCETRVHIHDKRDLLVGDYRYFAADGECQPVANPDGPRRLWA